MIRISSPIFLVLSISCLFIRFQNAESESSSLKGAFILFRHGKRAPQISYPNDPYKDFDWPNGYGSLTEIGIRQMYNSGVKFGKRFSPLLTSDRVFRRSRMQIRSSANPRCLMSAQSFMAGMLPPPANWVLPIDWQPALIEYIPLFQDSAISQLKKCPKYGNTNKEKYSLTNPEVKEFMGPKYHLLDNLSEHIGMRLQSIDQISLIADTLIIQQHHGLPMPTWAAEIYNDTLMPLVVLANHYTYSSKKYKIRAGSTLNEVVEFLKTFSDKKEPDKKLLIMSGHDTTILSLAYLLEINKQLPIILDFGSTLAIEIHENKSLLDDFELKFLFFRNHADKDPIEIEIPGCLAHCSISKFIETEKLKTVDDYDRVCNNYETNIVSSEDSSQNRINKY